MWAFLPSAEIGRVNELQGSKEPVGIHTHRLYTAVTFVTAKAHMKYFLLHSWLNQKTLPGIWVIVEIHAVEDGALP